MPHDNAKLFTWMVSSHGRAVSVTRIILFNGMVAPEIGEDNSVQGRGMISDSVTPISDRSWV